MIRTLLTLFLVMTAGMALAEDAKPADAKPIPYPLDTCIVSGEKLGEMGDPVVKVYEGREVKFCCKGCIKKFDKDPAKFIKAMDEKAKAGEKPAQAGKEAKPADTHDGHQH